jgi:hypothetical protein
MKEGTAVLSSFDNQQQYGLPSPLDAIEKLREELLHKTVTDAQLVKETGDLLFQFADNSSYQVFNFTGYEAWEINFPDGTGEYSNYVFE